MSRWYISQFATRGHPSCSCWAGTPSPATGGQEEFRRGVSGSGGANPWDWKARGLDLTCSTKATYVSKGISLVNDSWLMISWGIILSNLIGGWEQFLFFHIYIIFENSNRDWRIHIFQRGGSTTNQIKHHPNLPMGCKNHQDMGGLPWRFTNIGIHDLMWFPFCRSGSPAETMQRW